MEPWFLSQDEMGKFGVLKNNAEHGLNFGNVLGVLLDQFNLIKIKSCFPPMRKITCRPSPSTSLPPRWKFILYITKILKVSDCGVSECDAEGVFRACRRANLPDPTSWTTSKQHKFSQPSTDHCLSMETEQPLAKRRRFIRSVQSQIIPLGNPARLQWSHECNSETA